VINAGLVGFSNPVLITGAVLTASLALFVDCEVGAIGPRRRPVTDSLSVLDVKRLEVLGTSPK
jgi:hypothetical protein